MHVRFRRAFTFAAFIPLLCIVPVCTLAQTTTRISVGLAGVQSNNDSFEPKISADGRFVVFRSYAANLVAGDTNNQVDLFQRELATGSIKRLNIATDGTQVNGVILGYSVSADGRYVAFSTNAPGLVAGDTDSFFDVFLRDTVNNTTVRISNGSNNTAVNGSSTFPTISADGRYVAFESFATNLVANDTNEVRDVFVHDRNTASTTLVSAGINGVPSNAQSFNAVVSRDGSRVAFYSEGNNLVAGDVNGFGDVFVRNIAASTTTLVSVTTNGIQGNGASGIEDISLSQDGKLIAFDSEATNLVAGDTNASVDVFVRDLTVPATPATTRISVGAGGVQGNGFSYLDAISPNGQYIVFDSNATNLTAGDTNANFDVFLYNRSSGATTRVSLGTGNIEGNDESSFADISADGSRIVFASYATNLVSGDTNQNIDIFLRSLGNTGASLTGTLSLQGIAPTAPSQTLTLTFRSGGVDTVKTVSVGQAGAFTIADLPRANYNVLISGGNYLSKRISVDLSAGNVTLANPILMKTGDGNRDNVVDIADLLLLIRAYNQISPAVGYRVNADFNLDGTNDIADLLLVVNNYMDIGDILP